MLQCVAVCCSVLQCVAVRCSVLQCAIVCCSVLQIVAVFSVCSLHEETFQSMRHVKKERNPAREGERAVCCSVLQCAAVFRSVFPPRKEFPFHEAV